MSVKSTRSAATSPALERQAFWARKQAWDDLVEPFDGTKVFPGATIDSALALLRKEPELRSAPRLVDLVKWVAKGKIPADKTDAVLKEALKGMEDAKSFSRLPRERKMDLLAYFSLWKGNRADHVPSNSRQTTGFEIHEHERRGNALASAPVPKTILDQVRKHSHLLKFADQIPWMTVTVISVERHGKAYGYDVAIHDGPGPQERFRIQGDGKILDASVWGLPGQKTYTDLLKAHPTLPAPAMPLGYGNLASTPSGDHSAHVQGARSANSGDSDLQRLLRAAENQPWFVAAAMVKQLGGMRHQGKVVKRPHILEVTVSHGHRADAQALLDRLEIDGRVVEKRRVPGMDTHNPHGWRLGRGPR